MSETEESAAVGGPPHDEPQGQASISSRGNRLRAGVLGANDGIVSTAGLVMGVAGATSDRSTILVAGLAGLVAGAMSMAVGEYVSVSTQRDTERALLAKEVRELAENPHGELEELTQLYIERGLRRDTAEAVAAELTEHDPLAAHAADELGIDPHALTSPWQAALVSFVAFTFGALLPLLTATLPAPTWRLPLTVISSAAALAFTGWAGARLGGAAARRPTLRVVVGGSAAMLVTYLIGRLVGVNL